MPATPEFMPVSAQAVHFVMPHAGARVEKYLDSLNAAMQRFCIDTPARQAAFLAQIAHESGELVYKEELASGEAYQGRRDLGNLQPGDGVKFKGRGFIQVTGRLNYKDASLALFNDLRLLITPDLLAGDDAAAASAAWFWSSRGLNKFADNDDFVTLTKRINGGTNGIEKRQQYWARAKQALGVSNGE